MFEIKKPIIKNIVDIKYDSLEDKYNVENISIKDEKIKIDSSIEINSCKFNKVIFNDSKISNSVLVDIIFENCDLSNVVITSSTVHRIIFNNCKLLGLNFIDCSIQDVVITDSTCNYINFAGNKMNYILFEHSNFTECSLIDNKIKNIEFNDINLSSSEIINTSLKDIDLSNSKIENISISLFDLRGAIINSYQSYDLISLLGVKIKE